MRKHLLLLSVMLTMAALPAFAQTVTGRVTSSSDNSALPGVSVVLKGTTRGTATDADGQYSLNVGSDGGTLVISFIGYATQEVAIDNKTTIDVLLQEDISQLGEVVITGFGETKETAKVTYAVQEVKGAELVRANTGNVVNALQGKVAGVMIDQGTGGPMSSSRIRIRGNSSLSPNGQPLFVVDGVLIRPGVTGSGPWGDGQDFGNIMKNLNSDNIESMTVLKGSAASALYGSDALNGVVLITTKKGVSRPGIGVTYNHTTSFETAYKFVDLQNEFGGGNASTFAKDADGIEFIDPTFYYYSYGPKMDGRMVKDVDGRMTKYAANDPLDFFQTGKYINNNVSLEAGNDQSTLRFSYSNLDNSTITPSGTKMKRNNFNFNATHKAGKTFDIGLGVDFTNNQLKNPIRQGGNTSPVFALIYGQPRNLDIDYWQNNYHDPIEGGMLSADNDPYSIAQFLWNTYEDNSWRTENVMRANIDLTTHLLPWLNLVTRANLLTEDYKNERKQLGNGARYTGGLYSQSAEANKQYRVQGLLTANKQLGSDFFLSATVGGETNKNVGGRFYELETRGGLRIPGVYSIENGVDGKTVNTRFNSPSKLKNAFYIYGDLTWRDQLTFTFSHRTDFSSTLVYADGSGDKSYSYPAGGLAWTFTEAIRDTKPNWLSSGKIRGNFGVTGGDTDAWTINRTGSYKGNGEFLTPSDVVNYYGFYDNTLPNATLKNREAREFEVGTDLQFFENRIGIEASFYDKTVRNEIFTLPTAIESGVSGRIINGGKIQNKGIEVVVRATPVKTADFQWNTIVNFTRNRNKVLELAPGITQYSLQTAFGTDVAAVAIPGEEYGMIVTNYGFASYQAKDAEGNPIDHPSNGQKVIGNPNGSANALTYIRSVDYGQGQKKIGSSMEKFLLSNINSVTYKNFTLNVQVDAKIGGTMVSATHQYTTTFGATANTLFGRDLEHGGVQYTAADGSTRTDGIIPEGVLADNVVSIKDGHSLGGVSFADAVAAGDLRPVEARRYYRNISNWGAGIREYSSFENSWVSLREVSVGYNVPASLISKLKLQTLRLSVTGRNLAYLYRTAPIDLNPEGLKSNNAAEFSEYGGLPFTRQLGFSLTAGF